MTPRRALVWLILALSTAILGFGGFAGPIDDVAQPLALAFLLLYAVTLWRWRRLRR